MTEEATQQLRDEMVAPLIGVIVTSVIEGGGSVSDVLSLLETVVAGVLGAVILPGCDGAALPTFETNVRRRLAMLRLDQVPIAGSA